MRRYFILLLCTLFLAMPVFAEESPVELAKASINIHDKKSIERGAKVFATICMSCHTLIYLRNDPLAQKAGITYEKMPIKVTNWPFGIKPPDLSLETSRRGADWVYTYLHSFYKDSSRPTGANNLLIPNTAMGPMLMPFQGVLTLVPKARQSSTFYVSKGQWYDQLELESQGSLNSDQFDEMVNDIVNFLVYAAEPYKLEQERLGGWVLGYLFIFFIFAYLLKKSYWKKLQRRQ